MPSIAFFEIQKGDRPYYNKHLKGNNILFSEDILDESLAKNMDETEILSVFIHSRIDANVMKQMPNLRLITTRSAGYNHIDLTEAGERNIHVCYVPTYGENTVAEHTFALILALSRNIHKANFRTGNENFSLDGLQGFDLKGKTIAVIGAGRIGLHVIKIARGFDMRVLAVDPTPDPFLAEVLQFNYVPLEEAIAQSDIISLHAPLVKETYHLLNKDNMSAVKTGALLINTARGELVDTEALLDTLNQGILAGAGLDVLEGEELFVEEEKLFDPEVPRETITAYFKSHRLLNREDVVVTPHIGFNSAEAVQRIRQTTAENIAAFLAGKPQNLIKAP